MRKGNRGVGAVINDRTLLQSTMLHCFYGKEPDQTLCGCFEDIRTLELRSSIRFCWGVMKTTSRELGKEESFEILGLVESYLFRRAICDLPNASLNRVLPTDGPN